MKSNRLKQLMRLLVTLLGAGIGAALVAMALSIARLADPDIEVEIGALAISYVSVCVVFAALMFLFSERIVAALGRLGNAILSKVDGIPTRKLMPAVIGMLLGFVTAALLSVVFAHMGDSIFTVVMIAILYLTLGVLGYTIGYRRSEAITPYVSNRVHVGGRKLRHSKKKRQANAGAPLKLLDSSCLMDGRILDVIENGFAEGELAVPDFAVESLRRAAESPDPVRRAKGKRGLEILERLKTIRGDAFRVEIGEPEETGEEDVRFLRLAHRLNAAVVTCDYSLSRAARVSDLRVLSVDALANALRPALVAGETVSLVIAREGKEASQGVGFLPDGTMVVVDGARSRVGETVGVRVSSVLQTSAGRMIFAAIEKEPEA